MKCVTEWIKYIYLMLIKIQPDATVCRYLFTASDLVVNKYLHTVASGWFLLTLNYDARNHEFKIYIYLLTYLLSPRCRVLLEKLTSLQLVKKFPAFHGTRRFITALTSVRHLSLSWASPNKLHLPVKNRSGTQGGIRWYRTCFQMVNAPIPLLEGF